MRLIATHGSLRLWLTVFFIASIGCDGSLTGPSDIDVLSARRDDCNWLEDQCARGKQWTCDRLDALCQASADSGAPPPDSGTIAVDTTVDQSASPDTTLDQGPSPDTTVDQGTSADTTVDQGTSPDATMDQGTTPDTTVDTLAPDLSTGGDTAANACLRFTGALADDRVFTLEAIGSATFGAAPTIYLYTDLRDQTPGASFNGNFEKVHPQIVLEATSIGLIAAGRGVGKAMALGSLGSTAAIGVKSMPATTEVFISRALKVMAGGTWFGGSGWPNGAPEPGVFPDDSTFKMAWLMSKYGSYNQADNNLCLPSHNSGHNLAIGGNTHDFSGDKASVEAVSFSGWSLVEGWVRAEPANVTSNNGDGFMAVYSNSINSIRAELKGTVFHPNFPGRTWVGLTFPGWVDTNGSDGVLQTDLYVATGAQRVLLADHYDLALASKVVLQPHESWSDRTITAKLRLAGQFDPRRDPMYLHVFDLDNRPLCAALAIANPIAVPQGTPAEVGGADATSRRWVGWGNRFYLVPQAYQAQAGDAGISQVSFSTIGGLHSVVSFAIYESTTNNWQSAQRIAEVKMRPPAFTTTTLAGYPIQKFNIPLPVDVVPGRYYWRAVAFSVPYDIGGSSGGNVLISTSPPPQGECPQDPSSLTLSAAGYPLALSMTVVRP